MVESRIAGLVNQAQSVVNLAMAALDLIKSRNFTSGVNMANRVTLNAQTALQTALRLEDTAIAFAQDVTAFSNSLLMFVVGVQTVNDSSLAALSLAQAVTVLVETTNAILQQVKVNRGIALCMNTNRTNYCVQVLDTTIMSLAKQVEVNLAKTAAWNKETEQALQAALTNYKVLTCLQCRCDCRLVCIVFSSLLQILSVVQKVVLCLMVLEVVLAVVK